MKKRLSLVALLLVAMMTLVACVDSSKPTSDEHHNETTTEVAAETTTEDVTQSDETTKEETTTTEVKTTEATTEAEKDADEEGAEAADASDKSNESEGETEAEGDAELKDKYIMGLDDTFAPMGFRDESGEIVGFDIDLSKAIAEEIGFELEYQSIDWTMKESELKGGKIDFIWNGYSITEARQKEVQFSTPYLENRQIIVVMEDSEIENKEDMAGKIVTVQGESSAIDAMNKEPDVVASFGEVVEYPSNNECFTDLETGRADVMVVDEVLARYYMNLQGEEKYRVLDDNFGEEEFGIGMRKEDTALVAAVNAALEKVKEDGTYEEIYGTWFSEN